jgi:hypothetical protein
MLPYALAIAVGLSSSVLFLTAFFLKDIHRQDDFFWSGIGLFYALVLWFCATSITGAVLLGQLAAVALLLAYFWQVIKLRGAIANPEQQANLDRFSVVNSLQNLLGRSAKTIPQTRESDRAIETDKKPQFPLTTVTKETVTEAPNESPVSPTSTTKSTIPQPDSSTKAKTAETLKEDTADTTAKSDDKMETEATPSPATSSQTPEATEIAVESATIVEEDTNWADEDEVEIPVSSVKVIEETPSSSNESQTTIEVADSQSEDGSTDKNPESKPNSES